MREKEKTETYGGNLAQRHRDTERRAAATTGISL